MATKYTDRGNMQVRVTPKSTRIEHMTHWFPVRGAREARVLLSDAVIEALRTAFAPGAKPTPPNGESETIRVRRTMVNNVRIERMERGRSHYVTVPSLEAYLAIRDDLASAFGLQP